MEQRTNRLKIIGIIDTYLAAQENAAVTLSKLCNDLLSCGQLSLSHSADDANYICDYSTITKLIHGHPHLYKVEDRLLQMRSQIHRQCVSETLEGVMLSNTWTVCQIGSCLGVACKSNDFKTTTYGKGVQSIRNFMNDHRSLFEKIESFPLNSNDFMKQEVRLCDANICLLPKGLLKESSLDTSRLISNSTNSKAISCQLTISEQISVSSATNAHHTVSEQDFSSLAKVIDYHLVEKRKIVELWDRAKSLYASCFSQNYTFQHMKWFIAHHPHLYEIMDGFVSKRSMEHRMVLSELIDYLKAHKMIHTKKEIFQQLGRIAHEYLSTGDQCRDRALERFFHDHEFLFEIFSSDNADPSKRKLDSTCLRLQNVYTVKERLQTIDTSVTISAIGVVQRVYPKSILVLIESGECAGQNVYCKFEELSPCPNSTNGPYHEGNKVSFTAIKRMHRAYPWQATFIALQVAEEISGTTLASSKISSSATVPKEPIVTQLSDPSKEKGAEFTNETPFPHNRCELLALEEIRFRLLDSFLRDGCQTVDQIFQQFHELTVALPNLFPSKHQLLEFIKNRPHIFLLDETSQMITNTSVKLRLAMFDLLLLCQEEQSVEAVRLVILAKTTASYAFLVQYGSTKEEFAHFLQKYENIFELSELLPNEDRIMQSRGFCDARRRLFLPRWYFKRQ